MNHELPIWSGGSNVCVGGGGGWDGGLRRRNDSSCGCLNDHPQAINRRAVIGWRCHSIIQQMFSSEISIFLLLIITTHPVKGFMINLIYDWRLIFLSGPGTAWTGFVC